MSNIEYPKFNLELYKKGAPIRTRSGNKARLIYENFNGIYTDRRPLVFVITNADGFDSITMKTLDGISPGGASPHSTDIVMAPIGETISGTPYFFGDHVYIFAQMPGGDKWVCVRADFSIAGRKVSTVPLPVPVPPILEGWQKKATNWNQDL